MRWQLQDAKSRFSEVVKRAESEGPQEITVRGKARAVLISKDEFDRLTRPSRSLVEFLRDSPLFGLELDLDRDRDAPDRATPADRGLFGR